jgi:hypothetical protein
MKNLLETMLRSHPHPDLQHVAPYAEALVSVSTCVQVCTACADACLGEPGDVARLKACIRTDLDCADVCAATARLLARQTGSPNELIHAQLHACILACQLCADECELHASMHDHCRICAETCRHCQERCNFLLGEISSSGVEEDIRSTDSPPLTR